VLLRDAVGAATTDAVSGPSAPEFTEVTATWPDPRGALHVGRVPAPVGMRSGTAVAVWVTADGRLTTAPLDREDVVGQATTLGSSVFVAIVLVACGGYGLLCWRLARRRDRQWTQGWATVGPVWRATLH
jgi:hypothetical protein